MDHFFFSLFFFSNFFFTILLLKIRFPSQYACRVIFSLQNFGGLGHVHVHVHVNTTSSIYEHNILPIQHCTGES